jgi:hypothetical protein
MGLARFGSCSVIYITKCYNIYFASFKKLSQVTRAFSSGTNAGNIQRITGSNKTFPQNMAGYNKKSCGRYRAVPKEFST